MFEALPRYTRGRAMHPQDFEQSVETRPMTIQDTIEHVGCIGLGRMGTAIAWNILKAGFPLTVYNRTAAKAQPLVEAGAAPAASPRDAAARVDVVVTSLTDDQSVLDVVTGHHGILAGLRPGAIHIGTTTISPSCATRLADMHAAHGSIYLAAPVFGRPSAAQAGQLTIAVAGDPAAIGRCRRLFDAFCRKLIEVGETHAVANSLKLAANYMLVAGIDLIGQVYVFGEKSGVAPQLLDQFIATIFGTPLQDYAARILARDFDEAGFELRTGFKDVQLILQASTDVRVPLPYASSTREKFLAAIAHGLEAKDWAAIYDITRMNAGLT